MSGRMSSPPFTVDVESGCWTWARSVDGKGYGQIKRGGRMRRAHRYFYEQLVGPIPDGLELDHRCRNIRCVNPAHLEPVTHAVNCIRGDKGRKLTRAKVRDIKRRLADGESRRSLATAFKVTKANIGMIARSDIWKDVV